MTRLFRSAMVIARRDFAATVLSKTFIFFLLGPLFPLLLGAVFGGLGAQAATQAERPVVAVIASGEAFRPLADTRRRLVEGLGEDAIPELVRFDPERDLEAQQSRLLSLEDPPVLAVLARDAGGYALTGAVSGDGQTVRRLQLLIEQARSGPARAAPPIRVVETGQSSGRSASLRDLTARAGQFLLFFLTILLAGMLLSQLIEEKSNKVIEVLAAAVPIEAVFLGKLFAMLAASVLGIVVWTATGAAVLALASTDGFASLPQPAVGWPLYLIFGVLYFTMNYLVLGALFLGIGAQASTAREVQTLSMPVTMIQVLIFGLATAAVGAHGSALALAGAVFPLSSPLVMIARAAERPELWPHLLAIAWQALWVALLLKVGSRFFRSQVLKSGPSRSWWGRSAKA